MLQSLQELLSRPLVVQVVTAVAITVLLLILSRLVHRWVSDSLADSDTRYRARKVVTLATYLVIALSLAVIFSDRLGGLGTGLGIAGAGIAFALQEVIASIAGWVAISFGHFFRVGDRVQLGGIRGDVIDVGALRTTLMELGEWVGGDLYSGRIVRVANSFLFKEPVFNYSADFPFLWDEISLPVKYGSDHRVVRQIILKVADEVAGDYVPEAKSHWQRMVRSYRIEDASTEPMVYLLANDNWMEFALRYVVDYKLRRRIKDRLFTRLLEEFEAAESPIEIASASFDIAVAPPLDVRLHRPKQ